MHSVTIGTVITMLNMIEVRGATNLALLFNSIDTLKKAQEEAEKNEEAFLNATNNTSE